MDQIAHKNNYFKFDSLIKQQVSGAAIRSKFAPPYASIFMDRVKAEFLEKEHLKQCVWLRNIDSCCLSGPICTMNFIRFWNI